MKDRFAISSEIAIGTPAPHPSSAVDSNQRLCTAAALVDLLREAGLDCHLVEPGSDDSAQSPASDAAESMQPEIAKPPLQ
jgi:hypothetical protein